MQTKNPLVTGIEVEGLTGAYGSAYVPVGHFTACAGKGNSIAAPAIYDALGVERTNTLRRISESTGHGVNELLAMSVDFFLSRSDVQPYC